MQTEACGTMALLLCYLILTAAAVKSSPTSGASSGTYKSEKDLRRDLFGDYDKNVRPVKKWSSAVPLGISVAPLRVRSMDENQQILILETFLKLRWTDEYLQWNPDEYDNITLLQVPPSEIWLPDISLYTASADTSYFPSVRTNVLIYNTGNVMWVPPFSANSQCVIPLRNVNAGRTIVQCNMKFGSWTHSGKMLDLQLLEDKVDLTDFQDINHEWKLVKIASSREEKFYPCCPEPYPLVHYNVTLKKRPEVQM